MNSSRDQENIPEPRNNGNTTEAKAGVNVGRGGFQGRWVFYKSDRLGLKPQLHSVLAERPWAS